MRLSGPRSSTDTGLYEVVKVVRIHIVKVEPVIFITTSVRTSNYTLVVPPPPNTYLRPEDGMIIVKQSKAIPVTGRGGL
jgi:hypothetical protein